MARIVKFLVSLPFVLALGAVGVYALGGFVIAPWWIKRELPQLLKTHLNATGSVGEIATNPFALSVEIRDFSLTEAGGSKPVIAFGRLFVDFEVSSLFRRAWTFSDITLERPRIQLEVDAAGTLNLAKLAPKDVSPKKSSSSELPRLLLHKTVLKHGLVTFTDKAVSKPATAKLEPVEFELHDLSTLPDQRGEYTLSAQLPAGGALGWRGTISLEPIASTGQLELKSVKLATLWQFVQDKLRIDEPGGSVALSLKYAVRYGEGRLDATASDIAFKLNDVAVRQKGAADATLTAGELALTGGNFNLIGHKIQFAELALGKIVANTVLDVDGRSNWAQMFVPSNNAPAGTPPAPAAGANPSLVTPWQAGIDAIRVSDVQIGVLDHGFVKPVAIHIARSGARARMKASIGADTAATIDNIAVELEDLRISEAAAKHSLLSLASAALTGGVFDLAQKKFVAESILLGKPATAVTRNAKGEIDLVAAFARKVVKPPEPSSFVTEIGAIELTDGAVSFQDRGIVPALAVDLQNIRVLAKNLNTAAKPANGTIPLEAALQIKQGGTLRAQGSATPAQQRASIKVDARNISLMPLAALLEKDTALKLASGTAYAAGQLDWSGASNPAVVRYSGTAGFDNFRLAQAVDVKANSAEAAPQAAPTGSLRLQGTASSNPQRASLKLDVRNIALAPFNPMLASQTTLNLVSGSAHATGQLEWNGDGKTPVLRYTGTAGIDELRLDHEGSGERLFAWKVLLAEGIQVDSAQRMARIDQIRLTDPAGKLAIAKDRSTNFANLARKPATSTEVAGSAAGTQTNNATPSESPFALSVERVNVSNGHLDFSDQSLVLPFGAVIREFGGTVTGISTQPGTRASLKLEGRVDEFGQALASGSINLLDPKAFSDLAVTFRNVAMSPLTPYSATFAGRRITSGKLSLDLQYKLNNSQLLGENKVLLEQFTLGERVASPTAINLPLDLAIALLTDSNGKIDLSVPVRGNVDRPEFAYGDLVWQAIRTVLTNIVTAPFRALASLFGGSADKVDAIGFEAGRALLAPPEREKLVRVAGVLKQRPQLRLIVEGRYDTRHDGLALRTVAARRTLAERQGISLSGPDDPAMVNFDNAKTQRAIEALLEERAGKDSIDKLKADYEKSTGKEAKRVNAALALIGKGSPDREFYDTLFKRVSELQALPDSTLQELAKQRSIAILSFMNASGLGASRTVSKPVAIVSADKSSEITSALSLDSVK